MKYKTVKVTAEQRDALYKMAFTKQADSKTSSGSGMAGIVLGALLGAATGGGLGYLNYKDTPEDSDEDRKKKLWRHILAGAGLGTLAGAGLGYFNVPGHLASGVSSIFNGKPTSNESIFNKSTKAIVNTPVVRAALYGGVGEASGRAVSGTARLSDRHPYLFANRVPTNARRSIKDLSGAEQNIWAKGFFGRLFDHTNRASPIHSRAFREALDVADKLKTPGPVSATAVPPSVSHYLTRFRFQDAAHTLTLKQQADLFNDIVDTARAANAATRTPGPVGKFVRGPALGHLFGLGGAAYGFYTGGDRAKAEAENTGLWGLR